MQVWSQDTSKTGILDISLKRSTRYELVFKTGGLKPPDLGEHTFSIPVYNERLHVEGGYYDGKVYRIIMEILPPENVQYYEAGVSAAAVFYITALLGFVALAYLTLSEVNELTSNPAGFLFIAALSIGLLVYLAKGTLSKWSTYY